MTIKLNKDIKTRDSILFNDGYQPSQYLGGIRHFKRLNVERLTQLIDNGFVDLTDRQNEAPSIRRIYGFMKKYPNYLAHGYVVDVNRGDYRLSIEGVERGDCTEDGKIPHKEVYDFYELFHLADEYDEVNMYCWFD